MKSRLASASLALVAALSLGGCASQKVETYANEKPVLELAYFL